MARKKKRSSFSTNLKYEVYGILIITLSVIALSAEATVGRSLSKLFGLLLGKFYFVIPLVAIYVGLYVMIHRRWPRSWSARKTGLLLVVVATVMLSAISGTEMRLGVAGSYPASSILTLTQQDLYNELLAPDPEHERPMIKKQISGGYVGAISYTLFYLLFGNTGAKLILIVMYAIGFMLITGKSYVELARGMRDNAKRVFFCCRASGPPCKGEPVPFPLLRNLTIQHMTPMKKKPKKNTYGNRSAASRCSFNCSSRKQRGIALPTQLREPTN